jgi:hypothetical protein
MSFRAIAITAGCGVLLIALLQVVLVPALTAQSVFWYTAALRTLLLAMVAIAAALAANAFGWWKEYIGRAWTLFFAEYGILTLSEILRRGLPEATLARDVCVTLANLAGIGAYVLVARSLKAAGLGFAQSTPRKIAAGALAFVLAAALCYGPIVSSLRALGTPEASVGSLVSPVADVITFLLVAPLLLTTFALRGGQIFWMFALLTTGTIGWMVNQGAGTIITLLGGGNDAIRAGRMTGFAMACLLIAAAALTQWLAAQRAMKGALAHA